ncbi:zona pellucida sperm-binding protein 3 receptor-like [Leptopilina boulardi]|uniref:zona pellucida sperm-binding protein 3 receptor-like n=1 Tax=Leptopilina boulardi TaxID=63433 RepID=UPI0021F53FB3|nr:zona pellucida sperm-binding protein 3 receptor-like [Leptopilina boulardi]
MIYFNINKWTFAIFIVLFISNKVTGDFCSINVTNFNGSAKQLEIAGIFKYVTFSCEKNYTLIGPDNSMCNGNQTVSVADRFCKLTTTFNCAPFDYKNASVTFYYNGDFALITCKPGYYYNKTNELGKVDESSNTFQLNCVDGNWSGDFNSCQRISPKHAPFKIANGKLENFGINEVIVKCNPNYVLKGILSYFYISDKTWYPNQNSTCELKEN